MDDNFTEKHEKQAGYQNISWLATEKASAKVIGNEWN